jgi:hypothetical protein
MAEKIAPMSTIKQVIQMHESGGDFGLYPPTISEKKRAKIA